MKKEKQNKIQENIRDRAKKEKQNKIQKYKRPGENSEMMQDGGMCPRFLSKIVAPLCGGECVWFRFAFRHGRLDLAQLQTKLK